MRAFAAGDYPADPYPGCAPPYSFVQGEDSGAWVRPAASGWTVDGVDLDRWLVRRGGDPLAGRVPVLTYGSNRCPSKIAWMRAALGLTGLLVVLRAVTHDLAAVWAAGLRTRDGARPATLLAAPGARETHAVWLATPAQVAVLDRCEGRGERYRLARLESGRVVTEDGVPVDRPFTYLALDPVRMPLLVAGMPMRCLDVDHEAALRRCGVPATDDGIAASTVSGPPRPL